MSWSEVPLRLWGSIVGISLLAGFIGVVAAALWNEWKEQVDQRMRAAETMRDRLRWLEMDSREVEELRKTLAEKNDEIFEHIEANANLATERDGLKIDVKRLTEKRNRLLEDLKNSDRKLRLCLDVSEEKRNRAVEKLWDVVAVLEE